MGESKRRKMLDPNYGKEKKHCFSNFFSDHEIEKVRVISLLHKHQRIALLPDFINAEKCVKQITLKNLILTCTQKFGRGILGRCIESFENQEMFILFWVPVTKLRTTQTGCLKLIDYYDPAKEFLYASPVYEEKADTFGVRLLLLDEYQEQAWLTPSEENWAQDYASVCPKNRETILIKNPFELPSHEENIH